MEQDRAGKWKMKQMQDIMDTSVKEQDVPKNLLHLFQVCTSDFGLE